MKILVIGDPHFKPSNRLETDVLHSQSVKQARKHNVEIIVVLGDTLDAFEKINSKVLRRASDFLADLSEIAPLYVLIGNHDLPNNNSPCSLDHPFTQFARCSERIQIIDKPTLSREFLFVPYLPPNTFRESISEFSGYKLVFSHQEFAGCVYHGGESSQVEESWPEDQVLNISGHIHKQQMIGENLFYTGTPYQVNFGETDHKGIFLLDSESKKIERLRLSGMPRKRTLKISYDEFMALENRYMEDGPRLRIFIRCASVDEEAHVKETSRYKKFRRAGVILRTESSSKSEQEEILVSKLDMTKRFVPSLTEYLSEKGEIYVSLLRELQ